MKSDKLFFSFLIITLISFYPTHSHKVSRRNALQNFAIERALKDKGFVRSLINCILDRGPCDGHGRQLRIMAPEIVRGHCPGCSKKLHGQIRRVISHVQRNFPQEWSEVVRRFLQLNPQQHHPIHPPQKVHPANNNNFQGPPQLPPQSLPPVPPQHYPNQNNPQQQIMQQHQYQHQQVPQMQPVQGIQQDYSSYEQQGLPVIPPQFQQPVNEYINEFKQALRAPPLSNPNNIPPPQRRSMVLMYPQ